MFLSVCVCVEDIISEILPIVCVCVCVALMALMVLIINNDYNDNGVICKRQRIIFFSWPKNKKKQQQQHNKEHLSNELKKNGLLFSTNQN